MRGIAVSALGILILSTAVQGLQKPLTREGAAKLIRPQLAKQVFTFSFASFEACIAYTPAQLRGLKDLDAVIGAAGNGLNTRLAVSLGLAKVSVERFAIKEGAKPPHPACLATWTNTFSGFNDRELALQNTLLHMKLELTPEAQSAGVKDGTVIYSKSLINVTGVSVPTRDGFAQADYIYDWQPTPVGKKAGLSPQLEGPNNSIIPSGTAIFQLYDDGWRLVNLNK